MKTLLSVLLCFLCIDLVAQTPIKLQELPMAGSPTQLNTVNGLWPKLYLELPKKDTLNNPMVKRAGSLTIRPQDTGSSVKPTVYISDGNNWHPIGGAGVDTVQTNSDSSLYRALLEGSQIFTFPTLLTKYGPGINTYFTKGSDSVVRVNAINRSDSIYADPTKKYLTVLNPSGVKDSFKFRLKDTSTVGGGSLAFDTNNIMKYVTTFVGQAGAIPYAQSSDGRFLYDAAGLNYDGTYLSVGHNNAGVYSGFLINGGRAMIDAALYGMRLNVGSGLAGGGVYDATKGFTFMNRGNTYFRIYTLGLAGGPWTQHSIFYTDLNVQITPDLADNTAAIAAGLVAGDVYRTGDFLKIVH